MDRVEDDKNWEYSESAPWESGSVNTPADRRNADAALHEADTTAYEAAYGHIERRHAEVAWLHAGLQGATAVIGGLVMALGFHPILVLIAGVVIWRGLEEVVDSQQRADDSRRADHGVD